MLSRSMVTTIVRSVSSFTYNVWKFLEEACQNDAGVRLAELQHPSLNKMMAKCAGKTPIYVHPSFYRALKVRFPVDVGGLFRDGRVTTGSLKQTVGILTLEDFQPVVDTE